jgi:ESCRT-II complex subunit VPS36
LLLHRFGDSGVLVVERRDASVENTLERTVQRVCDESAGLSAEEMAHADGMAVVLARERCGQDVDLKFLAHGNFSRLLYAEKLGHLCRDESVEGLRFYANRFCLTEFFTHALLS